MKQLITIILFSLYITNVHIPTTAGFASHLLFHFTHCNIFHLLCNLCCLWSIKGNLHLIPAYLIATAASFIPAPCLLPAASAALLHHLVPAASPAGLLPPTQGFSAILLAIIGYKWGKWFAKPHTPQQRTSAIKRIALYILLPTIICAFIPNVNASLHFYSFTLAFILAGVPTPTAIIKLWKQQENRK